MAPPSWKRIALSRAAEILLQQRAPFIQERRRRKGGSQSSLQASPDARPFTLSTAVEKKEKPENSSRAHK
jgi:hypothetical protein